MNSRARLGRQEGPEEDAGRVLEQSVPGVTILDLAHPSRSLSTKEMKLAPGGPVHDVGALSEA